MMMMMMIIIIIIVIVMNHCQNLISVINNKSNVILNLVGLPDVQLFRCLI